MLTNQISELIKKRRSEVQIYRDLMQFRVREILLVTTYYDAYILEQEDRLSEQIFGEYHDLNLTNAPRITQASTGNEAQLQLSERRFDLVVLTMRISDTTPFDLARTMKEIDPRIPIILLLHDNNDLLRLKNFGYSTDIDRIFVWNRDSNIFLAMINYIEDKMNAENDAKIGLVRVILLVENSIRYYSRYLPILYREIITQTQLLIEGEKLDDITKVLRANARPKVLMAVNYEEAIKLYEKYKHNLLCVISDVRFNKGGVKYDRAGIELIEFVRRDNPDLPCIIQSSGTENEVHAAKLNAFFIDKNSETVASDLQEYIIKNLGFGDFVFRNDKQKAIRRASNMRAMKKILKDIPFDSLDFHARRNHFSAWLMARGEIEIAMKLQPIKVSDFNDPQGLRNYLVEVFDRLDDQHIRGKVIEFDEAVLERDSFIVSLGDGSLGGKGRGLAFINSIISKVDIESGLDDVKVSIPRTGIIGTGEFEKFISSNSLMDMVYSEEDYEEIKKKFVNAKFNSELKHRLKIVLKYFKSPIAVRSSSLFEDSISDSFSGVYETFLLPNNHPDDDVRLEQLTEAIKLVYASVFSPESRAYFDAINYSIEEEKMAVLIQEVAGNHYEGDENGDRYYPDISGVAQSYNYYPIAYMKPEDGIAVVGLGLGKYVIDGEKSFRFCPKYPKLEASTPEMLVTSSQNFFYAVHMDEKQSVLNLIRGDEVTLSTNQTSAAERDERLQLIASVWDNQNRILKAGINSAGPRIINFAYVLKYNTFPLAEIIDNILEILKFSMGTPVEIEFAANLDDQHTGKPTFYILQTKPLIREMENLEVTISDTDKENLLLYTHQGMGNGMIEDLFDIVYCDPKKFDKTKTVEMAKEIESINKQMIAEGRKYILIGPGRWGSKDRWLGIPVVWPQISNARIIVEAGLKDFHADASLGSHFFHNVTSMNIGYFTIPVNSDEDFIDWQWLQQKPNVQHGNFFVRTTFASPLRVMMDGRRGLSVIYKSKEP